MKANFHYLLIIAAAMTFSLAHADVVPYLAFRSQGINGAREMVGWQTHINKFDMDQNYVCMSITPECTRSFKSKKLAAALLCDALTISDYESTSSCCRASSLCCCDCSLIKIQGSKIIERDPKAFMAENFYLPTDYSSEISFKPVISNFIVDFNVYCGFDEWLEGLYLRVHTPLCYTRWNLHMCERVQSAGKNDYDVGYFNDTYSPANVTNPNVHGLARSSMLTDFTDYVCAGNAIHDVPHITYEGLSYARMNTHKLSATRLAEITAAVGYNFLLCEDYYLGINIRAAAPTGNKPEAQWLFEPIVGNGHHWELGLGLDSRWCFWRSQEEDRDLTIYLDATLTHLFNTTQIRTFDLRCKPLSRYMMATKYKNPATNLEVGATTPVMQFANIFTPVANITTGPCSVSAAAQGEVIFSLAYTWNNLQWDIGYNFWGRSCLKISRQSGCQPFANNTWGLKGDAFMYGFNGANTTGVPLSACEHNASLFQGTNRPYDLRFIDPSSDEYGRWNMNLGVDTPGLAFDGAHAPLETHLVGQQDPVTHLALWNQTNSSYQPRLLTEDDIDVQGAQTNSYSNKLFMHFSYTWQEVPEWTPFFGAGFEMEFGSQEPCCCQSQSRASCAALSCTNPSGNCCARSCMTVTLTQWGLWLKGGFTFK